MATTTMVFKNCFVCDYEAVTEQRKCPRCDATLRTSTVIRVRGAAIAFLGFVLIGIMTWLVNDFGNLSRVGSARNASIDSTIYLIVLGVYLLAARAVLSGSWLLVTGRRNRILLGFLVALGVALGIFTFILTVQG